MVHRFSHIFPQRNTKKKNNNLTVVFLKKLDYNLQLILINNTHYFGTINAQFCEFSFEYFWYFFIETLVKLRLIT